jgi:hypothetical protein
MGCALTALSARSLALLLPHPKRGNERLLRDAHGAVLPHPLLPFLLLVEQLLFPGNVAAIALGRHILPQRRDRFPGDDLAADRGLDRDLESMCPVSSSPGD